MRQRGANPSGSARPEEVLSASARQALLDLRDHLPDCAYLAGGTAVALRHRHRTSEDLDFFTSVPFAPKALCDALQHSLNFVASKRAPRSLVGFVHRTKVQLGDASTTPLLEPTHLLLETPVASDGDLLAMKLTTILQRRQLRDFDDLRVIEARGGRRVEEGLGLVLRRYGATYAVPSQTLLDIVLALARIEEIPDDPLVQTPKAELVAYWQSRSPELMAGLSRFGLEPSPEAMGVVTRAVAAQRVPEVDEPLAAERQPCPAVTPERVPRNQPAPHRAAGPSGAWE